MNTTRYILGMLMITILFGCKRDPLISEPPIAINTGPCPENYQLHTSDTFTFVKKDLHNIFWEIKHESHPQITNNSIEPRFNPENPYEISFISEINSNHGLFIYNFCTNKTRFVLSSKIYYYNYNWGRNDWIYFTSYDQNIWKIKSNGDSLTQFTQSGQYNNNAKMSPDGKYILYEEAQNFWLYNTVDNSKESTGLNPQWYYWLNAEEIISTSFSDFEIYNVKTKAKDKFVTPLDDNLYPIYLNTKSKKYYYYNADFLNENKDVYVYATDLTTHTTDTIMRMYDSYFYFIGDYNEQVDKVLVTLVLQNWKNDDYTVNMMQTGAITQLGDGDLKNLREVNITR